jgi:hypothetical protein
MPHPAERLSHLYPISFLPVGAVDDPTIRGRPSRGISIASVLHLISPRQAGRHHRTRTAPHTCLRRGKSRATRKHKQKHTCPLRSRRKPQRRLVTTNSPPQQERLSSSCSPAACPLARRQRGALAKATAACHADANQHREPRAFVAHRARSVRGVRVVARRVDACVTGRSGGRGG